MFFYLEGTLEDTSASSLSIQNSFATSAIITSVRAKQTWKPTSWWSIQEPSIPCDWPGCHKDFESLEPLHTSVQGVREIEGLACTVFECSWCSQIQGKAQERTNQAHELGPKDALQQSKSRRIIWRSEDAAVSRFQLWKKWNEIRREWVWNCVHLRMHGHINSPSYSKTVNILDPRGSLHWRLAANWKSGVC